jgi:ferredoxin
MKKRCFNMNKSDSIKELATALAKAQGEIENASKSTANAFFKSKYADLAECLNTVRPVLSKHGLSLSQFPSFDNGIASVESIIMHSSGEWLSNIASAPVSKQDAQGVGSATTYLRRYSLAAIVGIAQEDDDANSAVGHAKKPVKEDGKSMLRITLPDYILGKKIAIDADLLVLAAAVIPSAGTREVAGLFKVSLSPDDFFKEAHVKLRPVEFAADGVYLCGLAHYPKHITETISQAYGAAGRVLTLLSKDTVIASGSVCEVTDDDCVSCGACITACTYGAIEFRDTPQGIKAWVNPILCKGDGVCNAKCPTNAIVLKHFTDEELLSQIDAAITEEEIIQQIDAVIDNC